MRTGRNIIWKPIRLVPPLDVLVIGAACAREAGGPATAPDDRATEQASVADAAAEDPTTTEAPTTTAAPTTTTTEPPVVNSGTYVVPDQFAPGTYLVGTDIAPGRYKITTAGSSAYFARLDANLEIIDNNLSEGNVIAVVDPGDWALSYTGTIQAMP